MERNNRNPNGDKGDQSGRNDTFRATPKKDDSQNGQNNNQNKRDNTQKRQGPNGEN